MDEWLERFARASFARSADTAHDLKTPLNVAVLNLELLRMRMRKLAGDDDEKLAGYAKAIEAELRRMGRIFDAYFLLTIPPKDEGDPAPVDVAPFCEAEEAAHVHGHESRLRQAFKLFFEGTSYVLVEEGRKRNVVRGAELRVTVSGTPGAEDFDVTKIFKLYYSDLSLATARLIAETYGGTVTAEQSDAGVAITLSLPLIVE